MACQRFAAAIRAHAVGAPLAAAAAAHLGACPVCRSTFEAERRVLSSIDEALADVASAAPSPHFVSRLRAHLEGAPRRWAPRRWLMPAVAAALTLLTVALTVPRSSPERSDPPESSSSRPADVPLTAPARSAIQDAHAAVAQATVPRARHGHTRTVAAIRPTAAPEVLVPGREREAVGRLFASLRAGRPEVVSMLMRLRGGEAVTDAQGVTIEPLRIDPVVVSALPVTASILDK